MNTREIRELCDKVDRARQQVMDAKTRLDKIKSHNGQHGYSISVNGVEVSVSTMDSKTYQGTLIRGREMIHLGAIKALSAFYDYQEEQLQEAISQLEKYFSRG